MLTTLRAELPRERAVILWAANAVVAALAVYWFHVNQVTEAQITTITAAVVTILLTALTAPHTVSFTSGGLATLATAAAGYGTHLAAGKTGAVVAVVSLLLALVHRANVSPVPFAQPPVRSPATDQ